MKRNEFDVGCAELRIEKMAYKFVIRHEHDVQRDRRTDDVRCKIKQTDNAVDSDIMWFLRLPEWRWLDEVYKYRFEITLWKRCSTLPNSNHSTIRSARMQTISYRKMWPHIVCFSCSWWTHYFVKVNFSYRKLCVCRIVNEFIFHSHHSRICCERKSHDFSLVFFS